MSILILGETFGKVIFYPFLKIAASCKMTIYTNLPTPPHAKRQLASLVWQTALASYVSEKRYLVILIQTEHLEVYAY